MSNHLLQLHVQLHNLQEIRFVFCVLKSQNVFEHKGVATFMWDLKSVRHKEHKENQELQFVFWQIIFDEQGAVVSDSSAVVYVSLVYYVSWSWFTSADILNELCYWETTYVHWQTHNMQQAMYANHVGSCVTDKRGQFNISPCFCG